MRSPHPHELDELKDLREAVESCWRRMDLALLRRRLGAGNDEECDALAAAYRTADALYRSRCREHRRSLRPIEAVLES